jgi:phosphoribosyl 1,2-cyclic phosphodiesterase
MKYAALASGSDGNCHAFHDGQHILLVDAGISLKQIKARIIATGWDPLQIKAVAFSHEHSDHISAIPVLLRNTNWLFLATKKTFAAITSIFGIEIPSNRLIVLRHEYATDCGDIKVTPFATPHDAVDSVAFRIETDKFCAAIVTDLGYQTNLVTEYCKDLDLIVIEANHDVQMLMQGNYPPALKSRILSNVGHLSNKNMSTLLADILSTRLATVVLAHLSTKNNSTTLAQIAAKEVLKNSTATLYLAKQHNALLVTN